MGASGWLSVVRCSSVFIAIYGFQKYVILFAFVSR